MMVGRMINISFNKIPVFTELSKHSTSSAIFRINIGITTNKDVSIWMFLSKILDAMIKLDKFFYEVSVPPCSW